MVGGLKDVLKHSPLYDAVTFMRRTAPYDAVCQLREEAMYRRDLRVWQSDGKPLPPPSSIKQGIVKSYARVFRLRALVETGTFFGEMVYATRHTFAKIYSIELDKRLYANAKQRFARWRHISILEGDSSSVLPGVLASIDGPCLFWLDAHYSGGVTARGEIQTPIVQELKHIFGHAAAEHVILIDDARAFTGRNDYPTLDTLEGFVHSHRPGWTFEVRNDIVRMHKRLVGAAMQRRLAI